MKFNHLGNSSYANTITQYLEQNFPAKAHISRNNLVQSIKETVIGTKEYRYGPILPTATSIEDTIKAAIAMDHPIPIVVPWGGRKMNESLSIDVAEFSGIRQLVLLDKSIKKVYSPGIYAHIRIEDMSAMWLYRKSQGILEYSLSLNNLIHIMKGSTILIPVLESTVMSHLKYFELSEHYSKLIDKVIATQCFYPYINIKDMDEYQALVSRGWKGEFDKLQVEYYLNRYQALYPNLSKESHIVMLADYFGGAKARYDLNGRCEPNTPVGSCIQLNFAHPVPSAPSNMFQNTIYRRTTPCSESRTHIAPWRSKGYLKIDKETGRICTKIICANDPVIKELVSSCTAVSNSNRSAVVSTDYLILQNIES